MKEPLIYLVDDDLIYHSITEMMLERSSKPHQFMAFNNGREALEQLKENRKEPEKLPELILLDINMPIMNGWDFLEELEKIGDELEKTPVISMMTSSSLENDMTRALNYKSVRQFVTKPITIDQIEELTASF